MICIWFIFGFFSIIDVFSSFDYKKYTENVKFDNYEEFISEFEKNKVNSARYWYYYGLLYKKITMLNLISDRFQYYVSKTKDTFMNSLKFKDSKYNFLSINELISMYNLFLSRGNEYIEIGRLDDALLNYVIARDFYECEDINVQIAFVYQLMNKTKDAVDLYLKCISKKPKKELLDRINLNLIDIYLKTNEIDKAVQFLKEMLALEPTNIFYINILVKMSNDYGIKIEKMISSDSKIRNFQRSVIFFCEKKYKESYELLKDIKLKNVTHKKFFSDVLYNYCLDLQNAKTNKDEFTKLIEMNISLCNDILYSDTKNEYLMKRIIDLYVSIGKIDEADNFIRDRGIDVRKLYCE